MTIGVFLLEIGGWLLFLFGIDFVKRNEINSWKYYVGRLMIMIGVIVNTAIIVKVC